MPEKAQSVLDHLYDQHIKTRNTPEGGNSAIVRHYFDRLNAFTSRIVAIGYEADRTFSQYMCCLWDKQSAIDEIYRLMLEKGGVEATLCTLERELDPEWSYYPDLPEGYANIIRNETKKEIERANLQYSKTMLNLFHWMMQEQSGEQGRRLLVPYGRDKQGIDLSV
jgi:hypothetical protein